MPPSGSTLPRIVAVIVTHRGGALLTACLASLRTQTRPADDVLVVVSGPALEVDAPALQLGQNVGFARAANAGVAAAPAGEILLLNDDTVLEAGCVAALTTAWQGDHTVYQPRILLAGAPGRMDNTGHGWFPDGFTWARGRGGPSHAVLAAPGGFSGAAVLLPRRHWEALGGFDARFESYVEDVDLSLRLLRRGVRVEAVPTAVVHHHLGATYGRTGADKVRRIERNRVRAAVRSLPAPLLVTMPLWTAGRYALFGALAVRGAGPGGGLGRESRRAALAGLAEGLAEAPTWWSDRQGDRGGWTLDDAAMLAAMWEGRVRWEDLRGAGWDGLGAEKAEGSGPPTAPQRHREVEEGTGQVGGGAVGPRNAPVATCDDAPGRAATAGPTAVVLPAKDCADTVLRVLAELRALPEATDWDVIVVDDGSAVPLEAAALEAALGRAVFLVRHARNRGYGGAQKSGYGAALAGGAERVVLLHGDGQYDTGDTVALAAVLVSGTLSTPLPPAAALGSRFLADPRVIPGWRRLGNRALTGAANLRFGAAHTELHTGARAYSAAALRTLPLDRYSDDYLFDHQVLAGLLRRGVPIAEAPVRVRYDASVQSIPFGRALRYGVGCLGTLVSDP